MMQVVKQTRKEKIAMYMKLSKKELANLIVNANDTIDKLTSPTITVSGDSIFSTFKTKNL